MRLYVSNRGSPMITAPAKGAGSVSVIDVATDRVVATWKVPGGGSPDMGNITADGSQLWLSGRFDGEVYVFDLVRGRLETRIKVGKGPHGLTLWPLSGRYSLGHTGNMR
jgi:YVTN family beta-propeller protein